MLTRRIAVTAAIVVATVFAAPVSSSAEDDPKGGGGIECGLYNCQVEVEVPGQAGGQEGGSSGSPGGDAGGSYENPDGTLDKVCTYTLADPQPPAGSLDWEGHQPGDGAVYEKSCSVAPDGEEDLWVAEMVWLAEPPGQEAVAPAVLAQRAVDSMTLLGPDININPRPGGTGLVGMPVWMAVDKAPTTWGPNTASAAAGGVTVTATAKVAKVMWAMGDGSSVTCTGPGTVYRKSYGLKASPDCGHVYTRPSADTSGGTYTVTATSTWVINWQGGGASGQLTEIRTSSVAVAIIESQAVNS
ncbi:ATP/GTP-binding protein [Streptomyces sp. NPDC060205]|uniref:ATP/GTP-binding protein n=1 Tax=Streptomyces sp. NPDC060205 TaxID=3347072 RepID=UPI00364C4B22